MVNYMKYEKRVVAVIDILGFENRVMESENNEIITEEIKNVLEVIKENKTINDHFNKVANDSNHQVSIFSDSIIISSKLEYCNFYFIVSSVTIILQEICELGFLARGGISIGNMVHNEEIAFGPALIEAVNLEKNIAVYPRVVMTPKTFYNGVNFDDRTNTLEYRQRTFNQMFIKDEEKNIYYLDYLGDKTSADMPDDYYLNFLKKVRETINNGLLNNNDRVKEKYVWMAKYFNETVDKIRDVIKFNLSEGEIVVDMDRTEIKSKYDILGFNYFKMYFYNRLKGPSRKEVILIVLTIIGGIGLLGSIAFLFQENIKWDLFFGISIISFLLMIVSYILNFKYDSLKLLINNTIISSVKIDELDELFLKYDSNNVVKLIDYKLEKRTNIYKAFWTISAALIIPVLAFIFKNNLSKEYIKYMVSCYVLFLTLVINLVLTVYYPLNKDLQLLECYRSYLLQRK